MEENFILEKLRLNFKGYRNRDVGLLTLFS